MQRDRSPHDRGEDEPSFDLALGTWFYKLLVDERPGGLPADFFTNAATSILLCDRIICDADSFESEMDFAATGSGRHRWLSSELFRDLHEAGILHPIAYRELLSEEIHQHRAGLDGSIADVMESRRARLLDDPSAVAEPLDPRLAEVNDHFIQVLTEKGFVPYNWSQGLLPALDGQVSSAGVPAGPFALAALALELPRICVLPDADYVRVENPSAYQRFRENLSRERLPLSLWMYGDPEWSRETYNAFRCGPDFLSADARFDKARERATRSSFEELLKLRDKTQVERRALQRHLRSAPERLAAGSLDLLKIEAREHELAYAELVEGDGRLRLDLGLTSAGLIAGEPSTPHE
jgi:hypothetical protein